LFPAVSTEFCMIKHATSSVFVFCEVEGRWRLGLIEHPRLGRHMVVGGHVEADETQAEAGVREAVEESGLRVRLLGCPVPALPAGYPHPAVAAPWWITELMVPADNHLAEPHVHVDHQYVAVAESPSPVSEPVHPFAWFAAEELAGLAMFEDTRLLAGALFPRIAELVAADAAGTVDVLALG
jgi:8-oxo-dGTP pyrophosphatase MutT (NUDIX family)